VYPAVPVPYIHIAYLANPAIIIIVHRDVFYLDHCSIIVILNIWVIVIPGVERNGGVAKVHVRPYVHPVVNVKVEFTIGVYGEGNAVLVKNDGVAIINHIACRNFFFGSCGQGYSGSQDKG